MSAPTLTPRLVAALADETSGATGVVRQVIDGLRELADDRDRLRATADLAAARLPWCAPMWHVVRAAYAPDPRSALWSLRERLDFDVDRSVATAVKLLTERGCAVRTAPGSALVSAVLDSLAPPGPGTGVVGLAGADAVGPGAVLNIAGTRELAVAVPTIVVATSVKLVPEDAFGRLGAPGFEAVPLGLFEAVVLDGEFLTPQQAGQRAAALD
ncbi:hypothetical protein ACNTMW_04875 [Planosporangium sp. 12N6]|uniref:hypothetical protein n=1 Tax=Planosporangium spinosum TaxID=3402278 RepID=UPI003CED874C